MRAERLEREFDIDVEWWPFELHPEIPEEGVERGQPNPERVGRYRHMSELASEAELTLKAPTRAVNSHRSLEAAEFARERGAFERYHRALFEAYWSRGEDIGDIDVLARLGDDCGLDGENLRDALETKRYASRVEERTEEARGWGVTGTPTFIFENGDSRLPVVGAQEYALFENVAVRLGAPRRAENQGG